VICKECALVATSYAKIDRHRFQILPACDLINLISLIFMFMCKVSESGDDSIFVLLVL